MSEAAGSDDMAEDSNDDIDIPSPAAKVRRFLLPFVLALAFAGIVLGIIFLVDFPRQEPFRPFARPHPPPEIPPWPWTYKPEGLPPAKKLTAKETAWSIRLPPKVWNTAVFSSVPSSFVLVRAFQDNCVVNLQTGRIHASFSNPAGCLSLDGTHYASLSMHNERLEIMPVVNGKQQVIPLERFVGGHPFTFIRKDRVLVGNRVVHLDQGKAVPLIDMTGVRLSHPWAITATGGHLAYLSNPDKWQVSLVDLETGRKVGELNVPAQDRFSNSTGIAFSRDGKKLCCGMLEVKGKDRDLVLSLMFFDLTKPRMTKSLALSVNTIGHMFLTGLDWLPDGKAVFAGGVAVVDLDLEAVLWKQPKPPNLPRLFNENQVYLSLTPTQETFEIRVVPLPMKQLADKRAELAANRGAK